MTEGDDAMAAIKIVTDSAADLPTEVARAHGIAIVPLLVTFGDVSYEETALSSQEYWRLAEGPTPPGTSQPPIGAYAQTFSPLVDQGHRVLCLTVTSRHSGTYNSAWSAAQPFGDRVVVLDTESLSWGEGWMAVQAAGLARMGLDMREILEQLQAFRARIQLVIQLDTVESLRRGGRAARLMPMIDRLVRTLSLKPLLNVVDGELKLVGVARSRRKGYQRMATYLADHAPVEGLGVVHARSLEGAQEVADLLSSRLSFPREDILIGDVGAVLSCHGGRGVLGALAVSSPDAVVTQGAADTGMQPIGWFGL